MPVSETLDVRHITGSEKFCCVIDAPYGQRERVKVLPITLEKPVKLRTCSHWLDESQVPVAMANSVAAKPSSLATRRRQTDKPSTRPTRVTHSGACVRTR